jgi:hypothetical protein
MDGENNEDLTFLTVRNAYNQKASVNHNKG